MNLQSVNSVYFLGVGGIGMSGLARYFHKRGCIVSGYDKTKSTLTTQLENEGIRVAYTEDVGLIPEVDLYVFTPAIPKNHPAFDHVRHIGKQWYKRSEVLQQITESTPTIAIAGTHGKTTTTALIAHILSTNNKDIAAFVGGIMSEYESNVILSKKPQYIVVEADEFDRSFHRLSPEIGVITSIDPDHLDIYGSIDQVKEDFQKFASSCTKLIIHESVSGIISHPQKSVYGDSEHVNIRVDWKVPADGKANFEIQSRKFQSHLPGFHNALNTCAAVAAAGLVEVGVEECAHSIESFVGIKRRFETVLKTEGRVLIDDYAHHPRELEAVIGATKELYPDKDVAVVFQPHLYSRTRDFEDEFVESLSMADEVILLPIYPARELPIEGVSSSNLLKKLPLKTKALVEKTDLVIAVLSLTAEVVLMLGAGDIDQLVEPVRMALAKN